MACVGRDLRDHVRENELEFSYFEKMNKAQ